MNVVIRGLDGLFSFRTFQQFVALYYKNALVAWRNRRATLLRLFAPFVFLLLALLIDKSLQANDSRGEKFKDVTNPSVTVISDIPSCHSDLYIGSKNCTEILYSPANAITKAVMDSVVAHNSIPIQATAYPSQDAIQAFLLNNSDVVIAAVHFIFDSPTDPNQLSGFLLQTNTTVKYFKDTYQDPNTFVQLPLQSAVHREISRYFSKQATSLPTITSWSVGILPFSHPSIATKSVLGAVLGPFIFAACMFAFVTQIGAVVGEKELGLRQALRGMGLTDAAYWMSWALWEVTFSFLASHFICIFGLILQFSLFLHNNYGLLFFLFFLFQLAMSSLALLVAAFIRKTTVAVYLGFFIFILGWVMQTVVIFGTPYTPDYYYEAGGTLSGIFSLFPWTLLAKGFNDLGAATIGDASPGIRWSQRASYCRDIQNTNLQPSYDPRQTYYDFNCVMSLNDIYKVFIGAWIGYFLLAIYFDNIMPNEHGVSRPLWYLFTPSYWFPHKFMSNSLKHVERRDKEGPAPAGAVDEDVLAEEAKMRELLHHRTGKGGQLAGEVDGRNAIEIFGLKKLYKGSRGCCGVSCCSCCEPSSDFWAIHGTWLSIAENQLFCLLGPNGAGKTTTINCLTGSLPLTYGEALVYGQAISTPGGMSQIRSMMGVCPQFDVLWNELSGHEHLSIYGSVKGIYWRHVNSEAITLLERVKLTYAADQRAGAYSGGMKRRLSVAIALLGDPKIVFLDEPTTGMDPISRRYVWDIIQEAKLGRAIVLTTHSMEEADILADRIAIMARGRLRCLGSSLHLKQKFGSGYQLAVSVVPPIQSQLDADALAQRAAAVKAFFKQQLGLEPSLEGRAYIEYLVQRSNEAQLISFLQRLEAEQGSLGVTDIQLSLTSLEEVFLNIARQAELEQAQVSGQTDVAVPLPDGTILKVPLGMEHVVNPLTQQAYRVRWSTDEAGRLVVLDCQVFNPDAGAANNQDFTVNPMLMNNSIAPLALATSMPVAQPVNGLYPDAANGVKSFNVMGNGSRRSGPRPMGESVVPPIGDGDLCRVAAGTLPNFLASPHDTPTSK